MLTSGSFFILAFIVANNPQQVNIKANIWLSVMLFALGCVMIDKNLLISTAYLPYPFLIGVADAMLLVVAPALYLSIVYFVTPAKMFNIKELLNFLPAVLFFLINNFNSFNLENAQKDAQSPLVANGNFWLTIVFFVLPITIYWLFSFKKLQQHQKNIRLFSSYTETVDLIWLRNFLFGLAFMAFVWTNEIMQIVPFLTDYSAVFYYGAAYYLAYFILKQKEVFSIKQAENLDLKTLFEENEAVETPKKQLLTEEQILHFKQQLTDLMLDQKPYLDSTLSLSQLAQLVKLTTHELSYLINQGFNDNFSGFVNQYRITESKRILVATEYQHLSIVGIAYEAGFNSKTAFNNTFKKITGLSPTEFQKQENF